MLESYHRQGKDFRLILEYDELIALLDRERVREAAATFLDPDRYVQVVLYPAPGAPDVLSYFRPTNKGVFFRIPRYLLPR